MGRRLVEMTGGDRGAVEALLEHPDGLHLYLRSRLDLPGTGTAYVWRDDDRIAGVAWLGTGRNLVLAGDGPGFPSAAAEFALDREREWVMAVGPVAPATEFVRRFTALSGRRPRLDRTQEYCVQRRETLPALREPGLRPATMDDLTGLAAAAARMSAEDFEIDPWRIDRDSVRRTTTEKIRTGRAYVLTDRTGVVFKVDLAVRHPFGGQVEGVYTAEDHRGRGIARRCMAELGHRVLPDLPLLTLHVASANAPALKAYEAAGYRRVDRLRLSIF